LPILPFNPVVSQIGAQFLDSVYPHTYCLNAKSVGGKMMSHPRLLLILVAVLAPLQQSIPAQTPAVSACPKSPHAIGYPAEGPRGNNDWYANADRTIWATFWGWDFVGHGPNEPYPRAGYVATPKVLWYKPTEYPLTVTGRRLDGAAPPLLYDIASDPRPQGPIQPSRLGFPTADCWELDAKAGTSELRFIVQVKSSN